MSVEGIVNIEAGRLSQSIQMGTHWLGQTVRLRFQKNADDANHAQA